MLFIPSFDSLLCLLFNIPDAPGWAGPSKVQNRIFGDGTWLMRLKGRDGAAGCTGSLQLSSVFERLAD